MPAKKSYVKDNNRPYEQVKVSGDLIFTIRTIYIERKNNKNKALNYNSESSIKYNIMLILVVFLK